MKQTRLAPASGDHAIQVTEYVCGLLNPQERAQVHVLLSRDDQALAHALAWEEELLALVDALPRAQPSTVLRERLQRTLGIGPPPAFQPPPQPQLLRRPSRDPRPDPTASAAPVSAAVRPAVAGTTAAASQENGAAHPVPAVPVQTQPPRAQPAPATASKKAAAAAPDLQRTAAATAETAPTRHESGTGPAAAPASDLPLPSPAQGSQATAAARTAAQARQTPSEGQAGNAHGKQRRQQRKLWFWRLMAICAASAAIVGFMLPGEPPPPPVQIVKVAPTRAAILQAPGATSTPGWTATLGPEGNLMMRPLVHTEVPAGSQVLLWTRSERIPEPRLLGRIDPNQPVQVPAAQLGALADDQLLEITLETDEDAAKAVPNGPILFIGQMTVFGSEGAAGPADAEADTASAASGPITR